MESPSDTREVSITRPKTRRELQEQAAAQVESEETFRWLKRQAMKWGLDAEEATDSAQETVIAVWRQINRGADWIYRQDMTLRQVAYNTMRTAIKDGRRGKMARAPRERIDGEKGPVIRDDVDLARAAEMTQAIAAANIAIEQLPPRERQVFELKVEGYSNEEIAEVLEIRASSVKTYYDRARTKLLKRLQARGIEQVWAH